ncbi:MAG: PorV/PorQ family protein [Melioribacteraceae bacterium]
MNRIKIFLILVAFGISVYGQSKVGTTAANFLNIPVGPRATSMGGAFVAVANDVTSAFWNPGGLSRLEGNEFSASTANWLVDTKLNWIGLAFKLDDDQTVAISLNQLDYGEEEITTASQPNGTGERWSAMDVAFGLSYARNLTDRFSIGTTIKYIQQRIWNESASAFAVDIGLLFKTQFNGLRIGMNISNFGTEMKLSGKDLLQPVDIDPSNTGNNANIVSSLETDSWTLPLNFQVGLGIDLLDNDSWKWTVATDAIYPNNQTSNLNLGTELGWSKIVYLRVGYNSLLKEDAEEGLTAGLGLHYEIAGVKLGVDYSYMDFGRFNEISRYALTIGF